MQSNCHTHNTKSVIPYHFEPLAMIVINESQRIARESFDLDDALSGFTSTVPPKPVVSHKGCAGVRLRSCFVAAIPDALLREFARETLGASRCSEQYLDALRIVLGNQAEAERFGYVLEMNQRVDFAPSRVMRTIIDQMQTVGISFSSTVGLGRGKSQVVQCFPGRPTRHSSPASEPEYRGRKQEALDDSRREAVGYLCESLHGKLGKHGPCLLITDADVPYLSSPGCL